LFYALWLPLVGITLVGARFGSRHKKLLGLLLAGLTISSLLTLSACGGSGSGNGGGGGSGSTGTPAGTYTITVAAAAGSTVKTTTVTLTVQ